LRDVRTLDEDRGQYHGKLLFTR